MPLTLRHLRKLVAEALKIDESRQQSGNLYVRLEDDVRNEVFQGRQAWLLVFCLLVREGCLQRSMGRRWEAGYPGGTFLNNNDACCLLRDVRNHLLGDRLTHELEKIGIVHRLWQEGRAAAALGVGCHGW